jgi:hypothetical protein
MFEQLRALEPQTSALLRTTGVSSRVLSKVNASIHKASPQI